MIFQIFAKNWWFFIILLKLMIFQILGKNYESRLVQTCPDLKNHQFCVKFEKSSISAKIWKIINFCRILKNHKFFKKLTKLEKIMLKFKSYFTWVTWVYVSHVSVLVPAALPEHKWVLIRKLQSLYLIKEGIIVQDTVGTV